MLLSIGILISAAYALRAIRCLSTGPERPFAGAAAGVTAFADLKRSESAAAGLLVAGILGIGFYPAPLLSLMASSVARLVRQVGA